MARVGRLSYDSIIHTEKTNDTDSVQLGAITVKRESNATTLTSQPENQLVYDETTNEFCLSDTHDSKYHPIRAIPYIMIDTFLDSGTQSLADDTIETVTFSQADVAGQHNVLIDAANNRILYPKGAGLPLTIITFQLVGTASGTNPVVVYAETQPIANFAADDSALNAYQVVTSQPFSRLRIKQSAGGARNMTRCWIQMCFPGHGGLFEHDVLDYVVS